jgi:hypothetical protein
VRAEAAPPHPPGRYPGERQGLCQAKVHFQEIQLTEREAEIPDSCPRCGADLREPGAVTEGGYTYYNCAGHTDGEFYGEGGSEFVYDEVHAIGYRCTACNRTLAGECLGPEYDAKND